MASEILTNIEVVEVDNGWQIPGSDPAAYLFTVKIEEENGSRDTYKTPDVSLKTGYKGNVEVYMAKSGKTYIKAVPSSTEDTHQSTGSTAVVKSSSSNAYLKDATTLPLDVYRVRANIDGLPTNDEERAVFFENVMSDADELLSLIEKVRSDS